MTIFVQRPIEVDAVAYRRGLEDEWAHRWRDGVLIGRYESKDAADACPNKVSPGYLGETVAVIATPEGRVVVADGDLIITNERGERRVAKPSLLARTHIAASKNEQRQGG